MIIVMIKWRYRNFGKKFVYDMRSINKSKIYNMSGTGWVGTNWNGVDWKKLISITKI